MASQRFRAVVFDLFGTLIRNLRREEFESTLSETADILSMSGSDFIRLWNETWNKRSVGYYQSLEADIDHICQLIGTRPCDKLLLEAAESLRRMAMLVLSRYRDDAIETLDLLKELGYKTGLISNCAANIPAVWTETSLGSRIDAPVFSCSVGVRKPAREIYLLACERFSLRPEQCLYVADGNERELTGAVQTSMGAVLFRGPDEDPYDAGLDRKEWTGPTVSRLKEVFEHLT